MIPHNRDRSKLSGLLGKIFRLLDLELRPRTLTPVQMSVSHTR